MMTDLIEEAVAAVCPGIFIWVSAFMATGRILVDRAKNHDVEAILEPLLSRVVETKMFYAIKSIKRRLYIGR
jgi:hypothetical protein